MAPGSEVAGQRQVQHLRSRRLGLAVGGVADGLVLLPQLRLGCLVDAAGLVDTVRDLVVFFLPGRELRR